VQYFPEAITLPIARNAKTPRTGAPFDPYNLIHDQITLQEINMEVIVAERGCGSGCACHES